MEKPENEQDGSLCIMDLKKKCKWKLTLHKYISSKKKEKCTIRGWRHNKGQLYEKNV